jgi:two-component system, chemotaxis family, response regulator Rcp1
MIRKPLALCQCVCLSPDSSVVFLPIEGEAERRYYRKFMLNQLGVAPEPFQNNYLHLWMLTCMEDPGNDGTFGMRDLRILVIEDSPSDVRLIREALKDTPVPVRLSVARDGVEGLNHLHLSEGDDLERPDLVLLDLNLPKKNGCEVLAEMKSDPALKQIPVLVMTSSKADDDISKAYALNANCYIAKPCNLNEYIDVVRAIEGFWFMTATLPQGTTRRPQAMTAAAGTAGY